MGACSVGIMQPYFFPYWGHFALIARTDRWVVFDVTQYTPKTWMNRNRILHPSQGWQYLSVPLQHASRSIKTHEARLLDRAATSDQLQRQLAHYKKRAPNYATVTDLVAQAFAQAADDSLVALNIAALQLTCGYLGIPFRYEVCSALELDTAGVKGPGDWAPTIAAQLGAARYVNPAGGRELFDPATFAALGVRLSFLETDLIEYSTPGYTFEPYLSIIDAMMWNPPEVLRAAVQTHSRLVDA